MNKFWGMAPGERNVLEIMHEIDSSDWWGDGDVVTAKAFRSDLNQCSGELNVLINSPGGDTFAAADIYTALREYSASRGRVICYITGIAASAASLIAMAGDQVYISQVGMIMIHDPWTWGMGNASELREMADVLDIVRDAVAAAYVNKTGKTADEIHAMMAKTTYMQADQAVADGFADALGIYDGPIRNRPQSAGREIGESEIAQMRATAQAIKASILQDAGIESQRERTALMLRIRCV